jgi:hypothetical protein
MSKNIQTPAEPVTLPDTFVLTENLDAAIQDTLVMLANVDQAYEQRREAIKKSPITIVQKKRLRAEVDSLHRKDREPLVLRLADLHYRMMRASLFRTLH